jgi:hypothetical protein
MGNRTGILCIRWVRRESRNDGRKIPECEWQWEWDMLEVESSRDLIVGGWFNRDEGRVGQTSASASKRQRKRK